MNLSLPAELDARWGLLQRIPEDERPVVFLGPYEHHSNELPWRESIADVVVIPEDAEGHVDLAELDRQLAAYAHRARKIGSFSAASNVTGILSDTRALATMLHRHGALAFFDFAAAGPYVEIDLNPRGPGLEEARHLARGASRRAAAPPPGAAPLPPSFEALRWFPLPGETVTAGAVPGVC